MQFCDALKTHALGESLIDAVVQVEQQAHAHPWSYADFLDAIGAEYYMQVLLAQQSVQGYVIAMLAVDEVHLLNLTVAPQYQRQGRARLMLEKLIEWAGNQRAHSVWLEVRASNQRALQIYERLGFRRMAVRKNYYRASAGQRETAIVMQLELKKIFNGV